MAAPVSFSRWLAANSLALVENLRNKLLKVESQAVLHSICNPLVVPVEGLEDVVVCVRLHGDRYSLRRFLPLAAVVCDDAFAEICTEKAHELVDAGFRRR